MLKAKHSQWFDVVFRLFAFQSLFPWCFDDIGVSGRGTDLRTILDPTDDRPVLYIANHSSWWDGLLVYKLFKQHSKRKHFVMMDEAQLRKRKAFTKLGAFSIDKSSPKRSIQALQYSAEQLKNGHSVWIFPQGDIHHLESRPLKFESGFAHVLHLYPETIVVPVTFYYTSGLSPKISVSIEIGQPVRKDWAALSRKDITEQLFHVLTEQLEQHRSKEIAKIDNHRGN
jgi:1-acyl-sn-glycerol-3-phosphate acyltransferase